MIVEEREVQDAKRSRERDMPLYTFDVNWRITQRNSEEERSGCRATDLERPVKIDACTKTKAIRSLKGGVDAKAAKTAVKPRRKEQARASELDFYLQFVHFKRIATILLWKSNNKNYTNFKLYKSIALLNILSKILKSIISKRIRYIVEMHTTLSNTQMKVKK